jgi:hypothetical protein
MVKPVYISIILIITTFLARINAANYFVDYLNGNDAANGISERNAWKTLSKVNDQKFLPGDKIYFRRGSVWTGQLIITSSGTKSNPIVYTAYGKGTNPVIKDPGVNRATAIRLAADWVIIENFLVKEAHEAGINIINGSDYNIVRNNEATKVGIGIAVRGKHNLVTHNYVHDLTMVVNNPGGDNDYGATGIWLFSSNNEVSYNRMLNCKAPSLDYGNDGGVVEFYGDVDSCYVHHNWGENCEGAFEVGGRGETLTDNIISYNVYVNNGFSGGFHVGGKFGVRIENMRIENNVFVDTTKGDYTIGLWGGETGSGNLLYYNNIFYIPNYKRISNRPQFIHQNNLYYLGRKTDPGFNPGEEEKYGDPMFKNLTERDFHLQSGSIAIDSGKDLGYEADFEGNHVPVGSAPDIGAYEYKNIVVKTKSKK